MKSSDFTAKGTSLREFTSSEPFRVKIRWGPPGVGRKKVRKSREAPIGMMCDVSPLTQGLRYHAACEIVNVVTSYLSHC